ncbi:hypothetical protein [Saccharothrix sp. ST-888]|uniref:hypothetical protein n=1 Tax=Saccharothrix sp. ST-888 TaxID=1427391 RepID=UPI0005EC52F2|nr:hypothetical protein [Saccharothrix sp. ST-888]KJK55651.1 hypothetical protein UK12_27435 [Saccharothrix sp. ST-888]
MRTWAAIEIPLDAPYWVANHIVAFRAVEAGHIARHALIPVLDNTDVESDARWDGLVGTTPGFVTTWYRLPLQGPLPRKRHTRAPVPGDGDTMETQLRRGPSVPPPLWVQRQRPNLYVGR